MSESRDAQPAVEYIHQGFVPVAKIVGRAIETYHTDYLGTPKEVTDENGEIVWRGDYDEYGRVKNVVNETVQNIRFQGQYEDAETGLYYNRFRYYDADGCRYVNQDPIGLHASENFYFYCINPNNWIDPFGLDGVQQYNITTHGNQPSPRSPYQSHHIVQDEWAKAQGFENYTSRGAPSILLDATPGSNQHAIITARQNARRDARIAAGDAKWSTTLKQELKYARADLRAAGVPENDIKKAMKEARKHFKGC